MKDSTPVFKGKNAVSKDELAEELEYLRSSNAKLKEIISRYERTIKRKIEPLRDLEEELEVQSELALTAEKLFSCERDDVIERGEELSTENEELRIQIEEFRVSNENYVKALETLKKSEAALEDARAEAEMYLDLMGHDIMNMDQIAMGFLEMALDTMELDDASREMITKPLEALESTTTLIRNIKRLRAAKENGLKLHKVDLEHVLDKVISKFSNIPGRQITLIKMCNPGCEVIANGLLDDVLSNLVGNAIKHSTGPLTINVCVEKMLDAGREYCRISIEDNGPGIPDVQKEYLFNRFQNRGQKANCKGLGLYLVKTLVEDFNGKVWVEDRVHGDNTKGCRFVVLLPAVDR
jgi:signal transduction histidine kinase